MQEQLLPDDGDLCNCAFFNSCRTAEFCLRGAGLTALVLLLLVIVTAWLLLKVLDQALRATWDHLPFELQKDLLRTLDERRTLPNSAQDEDQDDDEEELAGDLSLYAAKAPPRITSLEATPAEESEGEEERPRERLEERLEERLRR